MCIYFVNVKCGAVTQGHGYIDRLYGMLGGGSCGNQGMEATATPKICGDIFGKENEQGQKGRTSQSAVPEKVAEVEETPQQVTTAGNMVR